MAKRISRAKKKKILSTITVTLVIILCLGGVSFLSVNQIRTKYENKINDLQSQITANERVVYRSSEDIPAGSAVDETNTSVVTVPSSMDLSLYMTADDLGKIAVVDIAANQDVFSNMLGNETLFSLRETEYAMLTLSDNLKENDFVDVRIMYPNGENQVVLSKKCIKGIDHTTNTVFLWLDETNIMDMSSAIVDIYLHSGSILYTTKYIEDSQEPVKVNYQPSTDVMTAIANDPNIVDEASVATTERLNAYLRESLETRLDAFSDKTSTNGTSSSVDLNGTISSGIESDSLPSDESNDTLDESDSFSFDENSALNDDYTELSNDDTVLEEGTTDLGVDTLGIDTLGVDTLGEEDFSFGN